MGIFAPVLSTFSSLVSARARRTGRPVPVSLGAAAAATLACAAVLGCGDGSVLPNDAGSNAVPAASRAKSNGALLAASQMQFPDGFMTSVKTYGAVGDGVTDDTAAIQRALADGRSSATADYFGRPKALFFPAGTYLVRDTLRWNGCCVTIQGSGPATSTIRLAPGSSGFGDPAHPKPLLLTPAGNMSFHQNIWDIAFSVGAGNPGATALSYISNNVGSIHDVSVRSEDGTGHAGLDLTRQYAGPLMVRDLAVQGFDVGVDIANGEYGSTFEGLTVAQQSIAGVRNSNHPLFLRAFESTNTVPALTNIGGFVVLLDATLNGGSASNSGLVTNSTMYARNVTSSGYKSTSLNTLGGASSATDGSVKELLAGTPLTLTGVLKPASLNLPIAETPSYVSTSLPDWAPFKPRWYGDTAGLQALLNSGAHTIYFPFGAYFAYNEVTVTVPDTVNRIVGFSSVINGGGGLNGGGIRFVVSGKSSTPLVLEQFGYGPKVTHTGSRAVAIKDTQLKDYQTAPGAGSIFFEDVGMGTFTLQKGQRMWARQLDDEAGATRITNAGGSAWIMGLKTERAGTVIDTQAGGYTELLGALIYPAGNVPSTDVAFRSTDAKVSYMYTEQVYCAACGYATQILETRSGVTGKITASPKNPFRVPLFVGY